MVTDIEDELKKIWKSSLGIAPRNPSDDYKEMGGTSLLFELLVRKIGNVFGCDCRYLSERQIFLFSDQCKFLRHRLGMDAGETFVKLKGGNSSIPLVFIHPIGGSLFVYQPFLGRLNIDFPIYGIHDNAFKGNFTRYANLAAQAKAYVELMMQQLTFKEVILAGYSFGGSLAFEMSGQLEALGIHVKKLIMFDSWAETPFDINFKNEFKKIILRQADKLDGDIFSDPHFKEKWLDFLWDRMRLLLRYTPKSISVPTVLFSAVDSVSEYKIEGKHKENWRLFVKSLNIIPVLGNHETVFNSENIDNLIVKFNDLLV